MLMLVAVLAGMVLALVVERSVGTGRRVRLLRLVMIGGVLFLIWLVPMGVSMVRYDGHCYAFAFERWPCSFWQNLQNEASLNLFLLFPLYLAGLIFYTITTFIIWHRKRQVKT